MTVVIGFIIVLFSIFGGFSLAGGALHVVWEPAEYVIIMGAGVGSVLVGAPLEILKRIPGDIMRVFRGVRFRKDDYAELLVSLNAMFKLARSEGTIKLEAHIENPKNSSIFNRFSNLKRHQNVLKFVCDYFRLILVGVENPYQLEELFIKDIEQINDHHNKTIQSVQSLADALPALGIVAAVLGVIITMGHLNDEPKVLGQYIGKALVGTFLGVLLAYGFVGPLASNMQALNDMDHRYRECVKVALIAYLNGYAPSICVEFARKQIPQEFQPDFYEMERYLSTLNVKT